jgi:hypothetical protein
MELTLVVVSLVSLGIGTAMSVVAWKLARDSRQRSTARVDALEALALGSDDDGDAGGLVPALAMATPTANVRHVLPASEPTPARPVAVRFSSLDENDDEHAPVTDGDFEPASGESDGMFGGATERVTPPVRWYALVGVAAMMVIGAATVYALHTPGFFNGMPLAAADNAPIASAGPRPLELVSLRYSTDEPGFFTVSGRVLNPLGAKQLRGVVAVVYLFDAKGQYVGNGRIPLDIGTLDAGLESPFTVRVAATGPVARYRVGFRFPDGAVVAHIDKRAEPSASRGSPFRGDKRDMVGS